MSTFPERVVETFAVGSVDAGSVFVVETDRGEEARRLPQSTVNTETPSASGRIMLGMFSLLESIEDVERRS